MRVFAQGAKPAADLGPTLLGGPAVAAAAQLLRGGGRP
ncbi:MAG: hypothetical protein QOF86_165 [Baekduia sp.]|nr:hypothetical protein [Baekduia sp.]